MSTFPPEAPVLNGDQITASVFLNNPFLVARRLQDILSQRLVGTQLLRGQQMTDSGSATYMQVENIYAAPLEVVAPGGEYSLTEISKGTPGTARVAKYGKDAIITDEDVKRSNTTLFEGSPVDRALTKLGNSSALFVDQAITSVIGSAISNSITASASWKTDGSKILLDILAAQAKVTNVNLGYVPDTVLISDDLWAYVASNPVLANARAREDTNNPVYSGRFDNVAGLDIVHIPAANMPGGSAANAWVLDTSQLGFIVMEDLQDGYVAGSAYCPCCETKTWRDDPTDSWHVRARANFVPVVDNPLAGVQITGAGA